MANRSAFQIFEHYQKARWSFVQSVANLALKQQNASALEEADAINLLKPLLTDISPQIRQCAAIALGRIVHGNPEMALRVLNENFLPTLLGNFQNQNRYQKKSILFVLRSLCKHDAQMASAVVESGGLHKFVISLEDFDPSVKESAAWAIGYVARHNKTLAQLCVDTGVIPLLILCLQEPEIALKQIATSALSDIAKHTVELAQDVVDAGAMPYLSRNLANEDEKLKRQTLSCISSCVKHSTELAECAVEAEIFPSVLLHLCHTCPIVRKNAACLVRDIVKHTLELTELVVNTGGIGALIEVLSRPTEESRVPCITALGYIAGHSEQLAISVLGCKAVVILAQFLTESKDDLVLSVTAWTIGQIGKHTPEHSQAIAVANIFPLLIDLFTNENASEDLKFKCKSALKFCLQKCVLLSALEPLLYNAPPEILKYVLGQYSKVLPHDPKARRLFVTSGGLKKVQEIESKPGSILMEYITVINACFPDEIVRYYSPGYPDTLLDKVEQYSPQMMTVLRETDNAENDTQTEFSNLYSNSGSVSSADFQSLKINET